MAAEIYFNVAVSGLLTGLVYGLMALGLSVIFGVVRVVNFAHGEMMTIAMYLAIVLFSSLGLDPLVMVVPIAGVLFALGYAMQAGIINPFITRPEHSQFILLVAVAIIIVNVLLIVFGPDARNVQTSYSFDSFLVGPLIVDATKVYAGAATVVIAAALFGFFRFAPLGKAIRACADNYTGALVVGLDVKRLYALTFGLGAACVGAAGCHARAAGRRDAGAGTCLDAARLHHRHHRRARLDAGRAARRRADRAHRGDGRPVLHARRPRACSPSPCSCWCCCSGRRASWASGCHDRTGCSRSVPRRGLALLAVLLAVLLAAPWIANDYLLTVLIIILYFAYTGQAWNVMMGFAGQLSLGHAHLCRARRLRGRGALCPFRHRAVARIGCGDRDRGGLRRDHRLPRLPLRRRRRLFRDPHHRLRRVRAHRLRSFRWVGGSSGFFLPVANYTRNDLWNLRGDPTMFYYVMLALTAAAFVLCRVLLKSRVGYYWQAIREDEVAARSLGINTFRYKMYAVVISAGMTAVAGVFFAFYYNNLFPEQVFHISRSIEMILGPIIGGIGTLFGPIIGAFLLTGLSETHAELLTALGLDAPGAKQVFYGRLPARGRDGAAGRRVAVARRASSA